VESHFTSEKRKTPTACFPQKKVERSRLLLYPHPSSFQHTCTASTNKVISLVATEGILDSHTQGTRLQTRKACFVFLILAKYFDTRFQTPIIRRWQSVAPNQHRKWVPIEKRCASTEFKILVTNPFLTLIRLTKWSSSRALWMKKPVWTILHFISWPRHRLSWNLISPGPDVSRYYGYLPVVCSFFALLTVIVYVILWEKQNVHGYTIMAYSLTVFLPIHLSWVSHLTTVYNPELPGTVGCKILGTITHFLFISMFSWLTMISLDLWLTFR